MPPAAVETRHAAARRADQPPRRGVGALARALPRGIPRHRHRGHPRPLLPRQRRRLDPRARPRPRHPVAGQLLVVARAEGEAAAGRRAAAGGAQEDAGPRARVGAPESEGAPGEEQGAHAAFRGTAVARVPGAQRDERDLHPARPAPRRARRRVQGALKGLWRQAAVRKPQFQPAAGRHRRHHRPERGRQDDAVPHHHRAGDGRLAAKSASARRCNSPTSTSRARH